VARRSLLTCLTSFSPLLRLVRLPSLVSLCLSRLSDSTCRPDRVDSGCLPPQPQLRGRCVEDNARLKLRFEASMIPDFNFAAALITLVVVLYVATAAFLHNLRNRAPDVYAQIGEPRFWDVCAYDPSRWPIQKRYIVFVLSGRAFRSTTGLLRVLSLCVWSAYVGIVLWLPLVVLFSLTSAFRQ